MIAFSTYDSTEEVIKELIKQCEANIKEQPPNSAVTNGYLKMKIKALQETPRDPEKLEKLLKQKEKECENAKYVLDTERLVAEIEVLKIIQYLVNRNRK
jgi:hypothetical protein